jgi:hypothetical protein
MTGAAPLTFATVCSGIGAPEVAVGPPAPTLGPYHPTVADLWTRPDYGPPLGWRCLWHAEVEPFASSVLAHHWPTVPNLGDVRTIEARIDAGEVERPDVPIMRWLGRRLQVEHQAAGGVA